MSQLNRTLIGVFGLATVGSTVFLFYENFLGDDSPIYSVEGHATLSKTKERFAPGSIGHAFPYLFLSTRAVSNHETWKKRANVIKNNDKWKGTSVFEGINRTSYFLVEEIKAACKRAYKLPKPDISQDQLSWITKPEWKDIFIICRRI